MGPLTFYKFLYVSDWRNNRKTQTPVHMHEKSLTGLGNLKLLLTVTTEGVDDMASLLTVVNSNINSISSGSYPDPYNMTKYCLALMPSKVSPGKVSHVFRR